MKHPIAVVLSTLVLSVVSGEVQAQAQPAFTARTVNVRAGPDRDYPLVAVLPAGLQIWVQGCLPDYRWCDVVAGPHRGWVYAGNLHYFYQNTYVPVLTYGAVIGIGVLGFMLDDYWHRYYRERRWYPERHRWADRPPPPRFHPSAPPPRPGFQRPRPQPAVPLQPRYQRPVPAQPRPQPAVPLQPRPGAVPGSVVPAVPRSGSPRARPDGPGDRGFRPAPGAAPGRPAGRPGQGAGRGPRGEGPPGQQGR